MTDDPTPRLHLVRTEDETAARRRWARPRGTARKATVAAATVAVALGGWWGVTRFMTPAAFDAPPLSSSTATDQPAQDIRSAQEIAVRYETGIQTGDVAATCALDADADLCKAGFGAAPTRLELIEPVAVVQATPVTTALSASGARTAGVGVLLQWQARDQNRLRSALLVSEGKVVRRVPIGSTNASEPLSSLLGGAVK